MGKRNSDKASGAIFSPFASERQLFGKFLAAADAFDKKHGSTPEAARKQLVKEGLVTRNGKLTKRYGG